MPKKPEKAGERKKPFAARIIWTDAVQREVIKVGEWIEALPLPFPSLKDDDDYKTSSIIETSLAKLVEDIQSGHVAITPDEMRAHNEVYIDAREVSKDVKAIYLSAQSQDNVQTIGDWMLMTAPVRLSHLTHGEWYNRKLICLFALLYTSDFLKKIEEKGLE